MKRRKVINVLKLTLQGLMIYLYLILFLSSNWLLRTFGDIDFDTVLFQLNSPLKGTSTDILSNYIKQNIIGAFIIMLILMIVWNCCLIPWLKNKQMFKRTIKIIMFTTAFGVLMNLAYVIGIPQYIITISSASSLFEDYYVLPEEVKISFPEEKQNLIFIYLESMESTYASRDIGGGKSVNYISELVALADNNISFSNTDQFGGMLSCSGTGWTMGSILATTSGCPYKIPVEGNSMNQYNEMLPKMKTLGDILKEEGYNNYFLCGSDADFGGRKLYLSSHGNYEIYDYNHMIENNVIDDDYYVFWGAEDEILFKYAKEQLSRIGNEEDPFNFTMLTVDTHHPEGYMCNLCQDEEYYSYASSIRCASTQVNDFINWIGEQSWSENTTIVVVGDHVSMNATFWDDLPKDYLRTIYNCIINPIADTNKVTTKNRSF